MKRLILFLALALALAQNAFALGPVVPVPGEDTFTYSLGVLQLSASASIVASGIVACSGTFSKAP
jgi:hypothetical protein